MRRIGGHLNDRGSATVWVAMAMTSLCVVFAALLAMGQSVAARHRAGGAADLAALAAADRALQGQGTACAAAGRVAVAQGARVVRCAVRGEIADVTAEARFGPYTPKVRARAGPPDGAGQAEALPSPAPSPAPPLPPSPRPPPLPTPPASPTPPPRGGLLPLPSPDDSPARANRWQELP
ncbi:Rv3654c family TadE-like protein [Streptomyces sp. NPDC090052]|uniref:Rv3654c family TadE-like protein n=1 Tax=unclassified Streptomyces TaxID=2593676 RepID=UPI0037FAFB78|nr:flp pilus-assembly TadE/G-like family protein [Streptomyces sp. NBC_00963]